LDIVLFSLTIWMLQLFKLNPTIVFKSTTTKFIINFYKKINNFLFFVFFFLGTTLILMAIRIFLSWKSMCGVGYKGQMFSHQTKACPWYWVQFKMDLWLCLTCMHIYIYIYSSLLLRLVQGWKNLGSYFGAFVGHKHRLQIVYFEGRGWCAGWESWPPPQLNSMHDIGQPNAKYSAIKLESQDSTKAMKCSKCLITHFYRISSHNDKTSAKGSISRGGTLV
jgi:hypothetical protein